MFMRFVALFVFLGSVTAGFSQSSGPKFSYSLSLPQTVVKAGSTVRLNITVKNVSGGAIKYFKTVGTAETGYNIVVTDGEGKSPMETSYGRKLHGKEPFLDHHSEMLVSLNPGETVQEFVYLNNIYDLSQPGKYTVQVKNTTYASDADVKSGIKTDVKSNTVTLTVTP
jgi:hypothetical protein